MQWQPPQYDGGAPVNYTITVSPGVGTFTTSGTSIMVAAVPYNMRHTVSIIATNCNGNSSAAVETISAIGKLHKTLHMKICTFKNLLWPTFWAQNEHDYVSSLIFPLASCAYTIGSHLRGGKVFAPPPPYFDSIFHHYK